MNTLKIEGVPAIIYVDGDEFIRCQDGDNFRALFDETVQKVGGEVSLCVYKACYDAWLRERLSITASKG